MVKTVLAIGRTEQDREELDSLKGGHYQFFCVLGVDTAVTALRETHVDAVALHPDLEDQEVRQIMEGIRQTNRAVLVVTEGAELTLGSDIFPVLKRVPSLVSSVMDDLLSDRRSDTQNEPWLRLLVGESQAMQKVVQLIRLIGPRRASVLITGETGTGKELVAQAIHLASGRASANMVSVNCASFPPSLLEAELFGHAKGAYTGAVTQRAGLFERAHKSTILLDEVGEIPMELQAKLLRVLQEREVQRIGCSQVIPLDFRLIAATNIDLDTAVAQQRFRQDLYYRLKVVPLHMPALRERASDIPVLVSHFLDRICRQEDLPLKQCSSDAMEHLSEYCWPGNIRQLQHSVERAVTLSGLRKILYAADFPLPAAPNTVQLLPNLVLGASEPVDFGRMIQGIERALLDQALSRAGGNKARAASLLGMKRTTLLSKVKALSQYAN